MFHESLALVVVDGRAKLIEPVRSCWSRLVLGMFLMTCPSSQSQPFFTNVGAGLPGVDQFSVVAWADYDGDGRLDVLLSGEVAMRAVSGIWRNTGNGFTALNIDAPMHPRHAVSLGDYDNDGRWDLATTALYRNTTTG